MNRVLLKRAFCTSIATVKGEANTFSALADCLTTQQEKVVHLKQRKPRAKQNDSKFSAVTVTKSGQRFQIRVQEPLTFAGALEKSSAFSKLSAKEDLANQFLEHAANHLSADSDFIDWKDAMEVIKKAENVYPVDKVDIAQLMTKPGIRPTFNLASVINESFTLQRLVDLGTRIGKWEERDKLETAMKLDFNADVAPRIQLLVDNGIKPNCLGDIFTENPDLFEQDLDDLQTRIKYLKWRKFSPSQIESMILKTDSKWLNFSTVDIDARLGYIQKLFRLENKHVRKAATRCPQLVIWEGTPAQLENNHTCLQHSMGFDSGQLKAILLNAPEVLLERDTDVIQDRFDILHNEIGFSHDLISKFPNSLKGDAITMKVRLQFLKKLRRNQFNPSKPKYVSPEAFALYDDITFCERVAKVPVDLFNNYQKIV